MSFVLRPGRREDVSALLALDSFAQRDADRGRHIAEWTEAGAVVVALEEERPVGYGVMRRSFFHQPFVEMVMVAQSHRRRGVGRAIVRHFIAAAGPRLWISTNQSNVRMQALIAAEGFTYAGVVEGVDEGDPELFYHRFVSAS